MTPLLVALILVEFIDLVFAVDSVPAVFAITQDPFIVYTSNIFAILGLRSLYFALAAAMNRFKYLQISLAIVLVLVGCKIFLVPMGIKVDTLLSLVITVGILASGVIYSLWRTRSDQASGTLKESQAEGKTRRNTVELKMKKLEHLVESVILASRWLLVVFYLGLAIALGLYAVSFLRKLYDFTIKGHGGRGNRCHPENAGADRCGAGGQPRGDGDHFRL